MGETNNLGMLSPAKESRAEEQKIRERRQVRVDIEMRLWFPYELVCKIRVSDLEYSSFGYKQWEQRGEAAIALSSAHFKKNRETACGFWTACGGIQKQSSRASNRCLVRHGVCENNHINSFQHVQLIVYKSIIFLTFYFDLYYYSFKKLIMIDVLI